jgi:transposase
LRDAGALGGLKPIKRGPKPAARNPMTAELAQAKRENARLVRRLERKRSVRPTLTVAYPRFAA